MTTADEPTTGQPAATTPAYQAVIDRLRQSYDDSAEARERGALAGWKLAERQRCLDAFRAAGCRTLLEVGAGTGKDSLFFQQHGLTVLATDLSPAMVAWCRRKGVAAEVRDVLNLGVPDAAFDAVYSLNCLLHVLKRDLPTALARLAAVVRPGGLVYLGLYGGHDHEGVMGDDQHRPPRFYSYHTDEGIYRAVSAQFAVLSFSCIRVEPAPAQHAQWHFQSLLLQRG